MKRRHQQDVTEVERPPGPGTNFGRICADCNQNRSTLGGRTCKRTKQWRCAGCMLKRLKEAA